MYIGRQFSTEACVQREISTNFVTNKKDNLAEPCI